MRLFRWSDRAPPVSTMFTRPHPPAARRRLPRSPRVVKAPASFRPQLVVFVKEPQAGRVKTRLGRGIGAARATAFYRHMTATVVARLGADRRWRTVLAVAPDAALASRAWPASLERVGQGGGDLGARLERVMDGLPPGPVVIVGTDIPEIRPSHVAAAIKHLGRADAVLGPAPDGGYWLVGLKRRPRVPRAFRRVRWSSDHALADTRANLHGLEVGLLDILVDVDEAADLSRAAPLVGRRILPGVSLGCGTPVR